MASAHLVDCPDSQPSPSDNSRERIHDPVIPKVHVVQVDVLSERGNVFHVQSCWRLIEGY